MSVSRRATGFPPMWKTCSYSFVFEWHEGIFFPTNLSYYYYVASSQVCVSSRGLNPTNPFTILELQNPSPDVSELHKIRRSPDREALKLWKVSSGRQGRLCRIFLCPTEHFAISEPSKSMKRGIRCSSERRIKKVQCSVARSGSWLSGKFFFLPQLWIDINVREYREIWLLWYPNTS